MLLRQPHFGLNPNYAIHCSAFTINHGRTNARQWLRQAYSPPPGCDAFFPNASHWAELSRPFRALSAISSQHSAISRANKSTSQQFNNSPPLRGLRGLKARIISAPSRKGGVSMLIPWLEGCKPDIIVSGQYSAFVICHS